MPVLKIVLSGLVTSFLMTPKFAMDHRKDWWKLESKKDVDDQSAVVLKTGEGVICKFGNLFVDHALQPRRCTLKQEQTGGKKPSRKKGKDDIEYTHILYLPMLSQDLDVGALVGPAGALGFG